MNKNTSLKGSSGIAQLELAIVLAILVPLMVAMAVVWLPSFAKRSSDLNNALAALGACLVDPINLYEMQAGQLVVRDDLQSIVNSVVSNCSLNSGGAEACAMVFQGADSPILQDGTTPQTCARVNVAACTGGGTPPPGLMIFLLLPDGSQECDHVPGNDSSSQSIGGDYTGGGSSTSSSSGTSSSGGNLGPCPPLIAPAVQFHASFCEEISPISTRWVCCEQGTSFNSATEQCEGCPTGTHQCGVGAGGFPLCVPDTSRFSGGACCNLVGTGVGCSSNELYCSASATTPCCPESIEVGGFQTPVNCNAHQSMTTPFSMCSPIIDIAECQCIQAPYNDGYTPRCDSTRSGSVMGFTCPVDQEGDGDTSTSSSGGGPMDDGRIGGSC